MIAPKRLRVHDSDRVTRLLLEAARAESPGRQRLLRIASAAVGVGATATGKAAATAALVSASPAIGVSATSVAVVLKWIGVGALGGVMVSAAATEIQLGTPPALDPPPANQGAPFSALPGADAPKPASASHPLPEPRIEQQGDRRSYDGSERLPPPASTGPLAKGPTDRTDRTDRSQPMPIAGAPVSSHFSEPKSPPNGAPAAANEPNRISSAAERALREEVAALALAKSALNRGEAAAALEAVRAYRVRYPQGRLAPEAGFIEMEAALALGDRQRAVRVAAQLASGTSPSSERAREILKGR
jgi:hypothetical protein